MNSISALRKALEMTQTDFGEAVGVGQTAVSNYEKSIRVPQRYVAVRMKKLALIHGHDVSLESLLFPTDGLPTP
jgi:transcriptional regulator with XRE-family HTH domain